MNKTSTKSINIGNDFSRYPVGRYRVDGDSNGERFRDDFLKPALVSHDFIEIHFDDALGYNSSFLEEIFGGLVRSGMPREEIGKRIKLVTRDDSLRLEINGYIDDAMSARKTP